jgi:hypothetical protein
MISQVTREQIHETIDSIQWKRCLSRIPDASQVRAEASILPHFTTAEKATALHDLATVIFTKITALTVNNDRHRR